MRHLTVSTSALNETHIVLRAVCVFEIKTYTGSYITCGLLKWTIFWEVWKLAAACSDLPEYSSEMFSTDWASGNTSLLHFQTWSDGSGIGFQNFSPQVYRIFAVQPETDSFTSCSKVGVEKLMVAQLVRTSSPFLEPKGLFLLCSEEPLVGPGLNHSNVQLLLNVMWSLAFNFVFVV
jgi:hypothetical protein